MGCELLRTREAIGMSVPWLLLLFSATSIAFGFAVGSERGIRALNRGEWPAWWTHRPSRTRFGAAFAILVGVSLAAFGLHLEWSLARSVNAAIARGLVRSTAGVVDRVERGPQGPRFRIGDLHLYAHRGVVARTPTFADWEFDERQLLKVEYVAHGAENIVTRAEGFGDVCARPIP